MRIDRGLVFRRASRVSSLPLFRLLSPSPAKPPSEEEKEGAIRAQRLAQTAAKEIASMVQEGWTETRAAGLMATYLRDHGVKSFFHHPFAWFGERTRFDGIRTYREYQPSARVLRPGEVFILDVAPIVNGFVCDIGYTACLGENLEYEKAIGFLKELRREIPRMFLSIGSGGGVWERVEARILEMGYENIHARYPFSVLGHRVHRMSEAGSQLKLLHFGWQSYWGIASRGVFGQLLTKHFEGDMTGLWAVEPHLGFRGSSKIGAFGAKFEEILCIDGDGARWIDACQW